MALPELKSNILPDNEIITTHTQDSVEVISQLQDTGNSVESYVSAGNPVYTTHNVVPQVLTVLKENGQDITTVVEGFWDVVWSVNGQTGDVTLDMVVGDFIANHTYRKNSAIYHNGKLYVAKADFTTGTEFAEANWNEIQPTTLGVFDLFQPNHYYLARQSIWQNNSIYVAKADFVSGNTFNPDDWTQASGSGTAANITSEDGTVTVVTGEESVDLSVQDVLDPIIESLGDKVDKVAGKGLSANDYTTTEKNKLAGIESGAEKNAVNTVIDANYVHTDNNYTTTEKTDLANIKSYVPSQTSASNPLADKNFVNSSVQTATANFRGNWEDWDSVPTDTNQYPVDFAGSRTPTVNDYLVVRDASDYSGETLEGTWRFKYSGTWATEGKSGWNPEYQVNETPMTAAQLAAINSGITQQTWSSINSTVSTNSTNISNLDRDKVDKVAGKVLSTNDFSNEDKSKLDGIAAGAEVNIQSDWTQTNTDADDYIKNKPSNLVSDASYVHTDNNFTTTLKNKLDGIASGANVNVQSDWNATSGDAFIKNKPTIPTVNNATLTIQKNGTQLGTFTANASSNSTINVTVPTKTSDLTYDIINKIYPVGSIYMSATLSTAAQVNSALGGTWVAWGAGRVPVGVDTSQTEFNTVGKTGGSKTVTLTVDQIPKHSHTTSGGWGAGPSDTGSFRVDVNSPANKWANVGSTGGGKAHDNLQPYITCYMYKRTA